MHEFLKANTDRKGVRLGAMLDTMHDHNARVRQSSVYAQDVLDNLQGRSWLLNGRLLGRFGEISAADDSLAVKNLLVSSAILDIVGDATGVPEEELPCIGITAWTAAGPWECIKAYVASTGVVAHLVSIEDPFKIPQA